MSSRLDAISDAKWRRLARKAGFKVGVMARSAGISCEGLRIYLRLRFHASPKHWIAGLQMREAYRLLRKGQLVKEVADMLGFENPTHFSRAFRKECGNSPRVFASDRTHYSGAPLGKKV